MILTTRVVEYPNSIKGLPHLKKHTPKISYLQGISKNHKVVNIVTTPKSGTHLLIKALDLLGVSYKTKSQDFKIAPHLAHYAPLLPYDFMDEDLLKSCFDPKEKYIVTIRDMRDFLISYIQWIDLSMKRGETEEEEGWGETPLADKLLHLLAGGQNMKFKSFLSSPWYIGNYMMAERLMRLALPNVLFLKFEDLVGPEMGGNSKKRQMHTFKKLCTFTGACYTQEKIKQLIKKLPGETLTYIDQKKVGKWKGVFSEKHVQYFKIRFSQLMEGLGYSMEPNWEISRLACV